MDWKTFKEVAPEIAIKTLVILGCGFVLATWVGAGHYGRAAGFVMVILMLKIETIETELAGHGLLLKSLIILSDTEFKLKHADLIREAEISESQVQ